MRWKGRWWKSDGARERKGKLTDSNENLSGLEILGLSNGPSSLDGVRTVGLSEGDG